MDKANEILGRVEVQELIEWLKECKGSAGLDKMKPFRDDYEIGLASGIEDFCDDVIRKINSLLGGE